MVSIGKLLAASSSVEWDVRDVDHPSLGPIKFAVQRSAITTIVRNETLVSQAFVSCQKSSRKVAIELANAPQSDPAGGLVPTELPRLVCSSPGPGGRSLVKSDLAAKWETSPVGDVLARGLSPSELRRCVSIEVLQSVALPAGSPQRSQRITMEITPYGKALDSVFAACGEKTAFAPVEQSAPAAPQVARRGPAPASAPAAAGAWKPARTTSKGRTNVRASARIDSRVVTMVDPGTSVLVKQASTLWWEVKPRTGDAFRGYIREDRFALE